MIPPDVFILVGLLFCYFYILMAEYFTHRKVLRFLAKCNYIHETAVAIFCGGIVGMAIFFFNPAFLSN